MILIYNQIEAVALEDVAAEGNFEHHHHLQHPFITCEKIISGYQATTSSLVLPKDFVVQAFPNRVTAVELHSSDGKSYEMALHWSLRRATEAYLTRGWNKFSKDNNLRRGSVVQLGALAGYEGLLWAHVVHVAAV